MTESPSRVLIAGGGVGALETALALRAQAADRVDITMIADATHFTYRPLAVGAPFGGAATIRVELAAVAADRGFRLVADRVTGVDVEASRVRTEGAGTLPYDHLVLALGAVRKAAVPGALTFRGPEDVPRLHAALERLEDRDRTDVVFVAPSRTGWTLPLYELALLTVSWAAKRERDVRVSFVTPERAPLEALGPEGSDEVAGLLAEAGVDVHLGSAGRVADDGGVQLSGGDRLDADLVVALPVLAGRPLQGVPQDYQGFVPVDDFGRVHGAGGVYAIGDMTTHAIKQGGLAAQQADVAAACIAAAAGAPVRPEPYEPVLRALLFTGTQPRFLRHPAVAGHEGPGSDASTAPWWPPHKVFGAHLAPYLATHTELIEPVR